MKKCCKCNKEFLLTNFGKDRTRKDFLNPRCKQCFRQERNAFLLANKDRINRERKKKYAANPEKYRMESRASHQKHAEKQNRAIREDRKKNPDKYKNYVLKTTFGISLDKFKQMESLQGGVCKICKRSNTARYKRLAVDHCYVTNEVRGLLCDNCNKGLGMFKDSEFLLISAIAYLKESK